MREKKSTKHVHLKASCSFDLREADAIFVRAIQPDPSLTASPMDILNKSKFDRQSLCNFFVAGLLAPVGDTWCSSAGRIHNLGEETVRLFR